MLLLVPGRSTRARNAVTARMDGKELFDVELPVDETHLEVNFIGRRQIDPDLVDVEPHEELADLNAIEVGDASECDMASDSAFVVDQVIELHVAWLRELHHEGAVVVEGVRGDRVG